MVRYESGGAFRRALEQRLRTRSLQTGLPLVRLRKMIAFDRFLARLFQAYPDNWVVKGGLAMQLRLGERARTTKDIDVLAISHREEITDALRRAGSLDIGDWFSFEVSEPAINSVDEPGGIRHTVQAFLDSRIFEQFHIDVGRDSPLMDPVEFFNTPTWLDFAGLEPTRVACYPITQQIAEKLHAYTRPHKFGNPSRVKDFVDILLLAGMGRIDGRALFRAIQSTFLFLGTHEIPSSVPAPPVSWPKEFQRMGKDVGLGNLTLPQAYGLVRDFLDPILSGKISGSWDASKWIWC